MGVPDGRDHLKVLFATAEVLPLATIGELSAVGGALPQELARNGHKVRLLIPAHGGLGGACVERLEVDLGPSTETVEIRHVADIGQVEVYTVGEDGWFDREHPACHQHDDMLPFLLFSKAVAALAASPVWRPDVIHCNDWHCGLIAQEVRAGKYHRMLNRVGLVFTIHKVSWQAPAQEYVGLYRDAVARRRAQAVALELVPVRRTRPTPQVVDVVEVAE